MAQQSRLDLFDSERLAQQRILLQIEHPQAKKVEAGAPVCVDPAQFIGPERRPLTVERAVLYAEIVSSA